MEYFSYIDKLYTSTSMKKTQDHKHMKNMSFKQSQTYIRVKEKTQEVISKFYFFNGPTYMSIQLNN
jgi:hypothetical protein